MCIALAKTGYNHAFVGDKLLQAASEPHIEGLVGESMVDWIDETYTGGWQLTEQSCCIETAAGSYKRLNPKGKYGILGVAGDRPQTLQQVHRVWS